MAFRPGNSSRSFGGRFSDSRGSDRPRSFGGGRGSGYGRDRGDRGPVEMHDAVCSKCGANCQLPFRPTGSKPVFCSDCFRKEEGGSRDGPRDNFRSRDNFRPREERSHSAPSGISADQFAQLSAKVDKILAILKDLELEPIDEDGEDEEVEEVEEEVEAKK